MTTTVFAKILILVDPSGKIILDSRNLQIAESLPLAYNCISSKDSIIYKYFSKYYGKALVQTLRLI